MTPSFSPSTASGTAVTSCAKNPSSVIDGADLKLNLFGDNVFNLVIASDKVTTFSFNR